MATVIGTAVTVAEGTALLADLIEGVARGAAAMQMLQRDISNAQAVGATDIPLAAVEAARAWMLGERGKLIADLGPAATT